MLAKLSEFFARRSKKPWARFIIGGIQPDGQVKFEMALNKAFIKNIDKHGFTAESEEISVQNFLFGTLMAPKDLFDEITDEVTSNYHPNLKSDTNQFRK